VSWPNTNPFPNLEAGEVVPKYESLSLHDVHRSGYHVQLEVVDPLGLEHQLTGGFLYALSETYSSREVAEYDYYHYITIAEKTKFPSVSDVVDARWAGLFGHVYSLI